MSIRSLVLTVALGLISGASRAEEPTQRMKELQELEHQTQALVQRRAGETQIANGFHLISSHRQLVTFRPGADPIGSKLFPPELIMGHQEELGVEEAQRTAILKEIEKTQSQVLQLQWQMQAAMEQLARALDAPKIDESKALAQADRLMTMERDVKRTHLGMLIRIRNLLAASQRAKLAERRAKSPWIRSVVSRSDDE